MKKLSIWEKTPQIERSKKRLSGVLPTMECAKQLTKIVKKYYSKKEISKILDFGCASGHYYNELKKIDKKLNYTGYDNTINYINYAKKFFSKNKYTNFYKQDLFNLSKKDKYEIVFCCNVLLHLKNIEKPIKNLINITKKVCIIRTLFDKHTSLSKFIYPNKKKPEDFNNFAYQNTYSFDYIKSLLKKNKIKKYFFLDDKFNSTKIKKEFLKENNKYPGMTNTINNIQVSGSKLFKWKWLIIIK